MGDYLFEKSGEPDQEIEHLEQLLAPLGYRGAVPLPPRRRARAPWIVAGAALTAAAAIAVFLMRPVPPNPMPDDPVVASWPVHFSDGSPGRPSFVRIGDWIETGSARAELRVADIGIVELDAGVRAQIVASGPREHRLLLDHGALTAKIVAPARRFVIETKYAVATDLGCAFKIGVDTTGRGRLVVLEGAVGIAHRAGAEQPGARQLGTAELRVPAGAECGFSKEGAGPVVSSSAPAPLRKLVERHLDAAALRVALKSTRATDLPGLKALESTAVGDDRAVLRERIGELELADKPGPKHAPTKTRVAPGKLPEPVTTMHQHTPIAPDAPTLTPPPKRTNDKLKHDALEDLGKQMP